MIECLFQFLDNFFRHTLKRVVTNRSFLARLHHSGQKLLSVKRLVKAIALNNKVDESREFALAIQRSLVEKLGGPRNLGVKQAPFVVLIGAAMPSVLAEISFVTNPQEARLLKGNAYRQRIADALFDAVRKYQTSLRGLTRTAGSSSIRQGRSPARATSSSPLRRPAPPAARCRQLGLDVSRAGPQHARLRSSPA